MNTALKPVDPLSIPTLTKALLHCENAVADPQRALDPGDSHVRP
jgi:hypothetical protein